MKYLAHLSALGLSDLPQVGGKNASLGELIGQFGSAGIEVPSGFALTVDAWRATLRRGGLDEWIAGRLKDLNTENLTVLRETATEIRARILETELSQDLRGEIAALLNEYSDGQPNAPFAVRSSATAEDLPEASFAGQQDTYLNVRGVDAVYDAVLGVYASAFNERAIAYRIHQGYAHADVAMSVGIQRMVESSRSGVMFTLDPESGFEGIVLINAGYGLGEAVVGGLINPDEYYVCKNQLAQGRRAVVRRLLGSKATRMVYSQGGGLDSHKVEQKEAQRYCLTRPEAEKLAHLALAIEAHYKKPMDIEWGIEGEGDDARFWILQARPETAGSKHSGRRIIKRYRLSQPGECILTGRSVGQKIASGRVRNIPSIDEMGKLRDGEILVADMTDPDWEPVMSRAGAIITDRGGRTCHAAIIARELGVPAVVGTVRGTGRLKDGDEVTVSCAEGDEGRIYSGLLPYEINENNIAELPNPGCDIMMNVGNPDRVFDFQNLPNNGVGLARLEFIINRTIGVHPAAILDPSTLEDGEMRQLQRRMVGYSDPREFYVQTLTEGIATLAIGFLGKPVIIRLSDFKSNEYARLLGGQHFEPREENPMLGFRGASRYIAESFQPCFEMECEALLRARSEMGLENIQIMVPFVRTLEEAQAVVELLGRNGLVRGENGLKLIMMCELPVNVLLAEDFLRYFDGYSIGSNDLTQLVLGLDRDSALVAHLFDEQNAAIKQMLEQVIKICRDSGKYIGICGQGPSDHPEFARWLLQSGISSLSLNPDTVLETWLHLCDES
ncbi:MAG: phosphoenolpyruvate synthase [Gammaproteobacteria bacterium AqS3]|nr:phosphoenolpyruvate synthase [Gammaproteobacteria bacterium AqS3]